MSKASKQIVFDKRRILIDGYPSLIFAGEVHYFRLAREDWASRLDLLKKNGLNTVASYIPWLWHELPDASLDLTGRSNPQRDLGAFIDMCDERGLKFFARPGPFVMAELKNEGIPYRIYEQYPQLKPITWNGAKAPTRTLDYLAPEFLIETERWYDAVMPILAQRLITRGGPVIGVQLDNEIGMLSWVSNSPDLTREVCEDMRRWARERYGAKVASERIGADVDDTIGWTVALRHATQPSLSLHYELGLYMRERFARYIKALRQFAEKNGVRDVPFFVNIHGTSAGRCTTFPIGISQLMETYRAQPQMTSGSDIYLGDLTVVNGPGLYVANAFMGAVHDGDQPLTSLEFEAGNGDYGEDLGNLYSPEAVELKTRLCIAQGAKLFNFYLHAGGENPHIESEGDGIDRLAFTGQRHGFAAPVNPEGKTTPSYDAISRVVASVKNVGALLADSHEEYDSLVYGFVPDHYLTEYRHPAASDRAEQVSDLERYRGFGPREILSRALVLNGYSFPAVDLQTSIPRSRVLVVATGRTLGRVVQDNVSEYVRRGGKLLLVGLLPDHDNDGTPCTLLADALGLRSVGKVEDYANAESRYWPSVRAVGALAPQPEVRVGTAQLLASKEGRRMEPLLIEIASGQPCAARVRCGAGEAIMLGCDYPAHLDAYRSLISSLGVEPRWEAQTDGPGLVITSTVSSENQRLLHLINLAPQTVTFSLKHNGEAVFGGGKISVPARQGFILPMGVRGRGVVIAESTAELLELKRNRIVVRPSQDEDFILLRTRRDVYCAGARIKRKGNLVRLLLRRTKCRKRRVVIELG